MLFCGWLIPAHLRALDYSIMDRAGSGTLSLGAEGHALLQDKAGNMLGAAQLLLEAARQEGVSTPATEKLATEVADLAGKYPSWVVWGCREPGFRGDPADDPKPGNDAFTDYVVRLDNRDRLINRLGASRQAAVQELLRVRAITNTVLLPPSQSTAGQALDAAICVCGLLLDGRHLSTSFSNTVSELSAKANRGDSEPLEQTLIDLMSLGQRLNWGQLVVFVSSIQDAETLRRQAHLIRLADQALPELFAAVHLSGQPEAVADYVMTYSRSGLKDLGSSLRCGSGGIRQLLQSKRPLFRSSLRSALAGYQPFKTLVASTADLALRRPGLALTLRWLCILAAGFVFAAAFHFARAAVPSLERPLQVRGFHVIRETLFALGFLLVVLVLSEPFLAQESQKVVFPFRLRLPTPGRPVAAAAVSAKPTFMQPLSLITVSVFFVLQGLIYTACLFKLAEIRRQRVPPRMKLKLLENEEHLFDAGLYLGFAGTIISLILVSLGVVQFSLMAAYSSTSFGIIFVSIFKIFHLRPARRRLLLEAEAMGPEPVAPTIRPSLATSS